MLTRLTKAINRTATYYPKTGFSVSMIAGALLGAYLIQFSLMLSFFGIVPLLLNIPLYKHRQALNLQLEALLDELLAVELFSDLEGEAYEATKTKLLNDIQTLKAQGAFFNQAYVDKRLCHIIDIRLTDMYYRRFSGYEWEMTVDRFLDEKIRIARGINNKYHLGTLNASRRSSNFAIKAILDSGANPDQIIKIFYYPDMERSLLSWAILSGDVAPVKLLQDYGAKLPPDFIHDAVLSQSPDMVRYVIQAGLPENQKAINTTVQGRITPFIRNNWYELEQNGRTVYYPQAGKGRLTSKDTSCEITPLGIAALSDEPSMLEVVSMLVDAGALSDISIISMEYLSYPKECRDTDTRDYYNFFTPYPLIFEAVKRGHHTVVDKLLTDKPELIHKRGLIIFTDRHLTQSLLHAAASRGDLAMFDVILKHDTSKSLVNAVNARGETPLHSAARSHSQHAPEIIKRLIKNGADIKHENTLGQRALSLAAVNHSCYSDQIVKSLIEAGGSDDVTHQDNLGNTAIHYVTTNLIGEGMASLKLLAPTSIFGGIELNIENHEGLTPLGVAIRNNEFEHPVNQIEYLLKQGVKSTARDLCEACKIPLDKGGYEIISLLLDYNVDCDTPIKFSNPLGNSSLEFKTEEDFLPLHFLLFNNARFGDTEDRCIELIDRILYKHPHQISANWPFRQAGGLYGFCYTDVIKGVKETQKLHAFYQMTNKIRTHLAQKYQARHGREKTLTPRLRDCYQALGFYGDNMPSLSECQQRYEFMKGQYNADNLSTLPLEQGTRIVSQYAEADEAMDYIRAVM